MNFAEMLENAQKQERALAEEIERLSRLLWATRGQVDLLTRIVQEAPAAKAEEPTSA